MRRRSFHSEQYGYTESVPPDENEERVSRVVDLIGDLGFYDPMQEVCARIRERAPRRRYLDRPLPGPSMPTRWPIFGNGRRK